MATATDIQTGLNLKQIDESKRSVIQSILDNSNAAPNTKRRASAILAIAAREKHIGEISEKHYVSMRLAYGWIDRFNREDISGLSDKTHAKAGLAISAESKRNIIAIHAEQPYLDLDALRGIVNVRLGLNISRAQLHRIVRK